MKRTFTQDEKNLVFKLWKSGAGFSDIARVLDSKPGSIFSILREHGGIQPKARCRSRLHLTLEEREEIRAGLSAQLSIREIASKLNRAPSTIYREINKNGGRRWYKAVRADRRAWRLAKRPKDCLLKMNTELRQLVSEKLELNWSPEQISGWLKTNLSRRKGMQISHETIYKTLYIRSKKVLDTSLMKHLRKAHKMRQGRHHSRSGDRGTINIVNGVSIHSRSKNIDKRRSIGHWEGDLVTGSNNTHIATLVDRKTRYTLILKLAGKDASSVTKALINAFSQLLERLKKSLTWDRGMELAKHKEFSQLTDIPVYFCDPQSPWQRGTNENTNGLIRQYFPKKTCLTKYTQTDLDEVALQLNERPRKTLKFKTPKEMMKKDVPVIA